MSKSDSTEPKKELESLVQIFVYRLQKKNHDVMVQNQKEFTEMLKKHGMLRSEVFQLNNTETIGGFTSIANAVSANQDDEVWVELQYYKEHIDDVLARIKNDERHGPLFQQFMDLVSPGSSCIMGEFSRLSA